MNRTFLVALGLAALAGACDRNPDRGSPTAEHNARAGEHAGEAARDLGRGTVDALRSAGHGVVYGARELGQSLSGMQGNPEAEQRSARSREEMEQSARQAGREFDRAGHELDRAEDHVEPPVAPSPTDTHRDKTPRTRGGGPATAAPPAPTR